MRRAEMEAPLRRAASQTSRSRAHPEFISRYALSSPHAHHLDEESRRRLALQVAALLRTTPGLWSSRAWTRWKRISGSAIATRVRTLSNKYVWQTTSFTVHDFPWEALLSLLEGLKTQ